MNAPTVNTPETAVATLTKTTSYKTPDGMIFASKAEAEIHLKQHLVKDALLKVAGGDTNLGNWLYQQRAAIEAAYAAAGVVESSDGRRKVDNRTDEEKQAAKDKMAAIRAKMSPEKQAEVAQKLAAGREKRLAELRAKKAETAAASEKAAAELRAKKAETAAASEKAA